MQASPGIPFGGTIEEGDIGTGAVTETKIGNLAVTAAKIAATTITAAKFASGIRPIGAYGKATRTSDVSITANTYNDITDLTVTVTPDGTGAKTLLVYWSMGFCYVNGGNGKAAAVAVDQDGTTAQEWFVFNQDTVAASPPCMASGICYTAGTGGTPTTIKLQAKTDGTQTFTLNVAGSAGSVNYTKGNGFIIVMQVD